MQSPYVALKYEIHVLKLCFIIFNILDNLYRLSYNSSINLKPEKTIFLEKNIATNFHDF